MRMSCFLHPKSGFSEQATTSELHEVVINTFVLKLLAISAAFFLLLVRNTADSCDYKQHADWAAHPHDFNLSVTYKTVSLGFLRVCCFYSCIPIGFSSTQHMTEMVPIQYNEWYQRLGKPKYFIDIEVTKSRAYLALNESILLIYLRKPERYRRNRKDIGQTAWFTH